MKMTHSSPKNSFKPKRMPFGKYLKNNYDLYLMLLPALAFIIIFAYLPMYGVLMAFQDFNPAQGIAASPWVGLKHFERFFSIYTARQIIVNTIVLSLYSIIVSFPFPIILALMLNYSVSKRFGKMVQTVTYIPYFISITVLIGMMNIFFSPNYGIVNTVISALGGTTQTFMSDSSWFRHLYVWSGVWQNMGYSAIVYIAALSSVDPTLYEAATLDGASKLQRMRYIDIPTIMPTCVIMLLLSLGSIMGVGFEKVYLMQNDRNSAISEVISTYVYKVGLLDGRYSFSSAVNLFNSIINFTLLIFVNKVSKKISDISLW